MDVVLNTGDALQGLAALQDKLNLGTVDSEVLEGEQVLFPASPEESSLSLDPTFVSQATEALKDLGLYDAALHSMFDGQESSLAVTAFKHAVLSGLVATTAVKAGECSDATANALFGILVYAKDMELAGAALRSLICILGENAGQETTRLDAGHSFSSPAAAAGDGGIMINPGALPSAASILKALQVNGYNSSGGDTKPVGDIDTNPSQFKPAEGLRIQTLKLLLHTAAALCGHCTTHPDSASPALTPGSVTDLILAVVHMGLDPASLQLQRDLDAACIALLGALSSTDWTTQLPRLADGIAALGPSTRSRLRVLRQLPANEPTGRGRQLQRFVGCIVVERILPGELAPSKSAIPKHCMGVPDPEAVLQGQPWFFNPKGVVAGASNSAHTFFDIELLLHICDVLLWPAAMRAMKQRSGNFTGPSQGFSPGIDVLMSGGDDPLGLDDDPISQEFLTVWCNFLGGLDRSIKTTLQPEEMAVRTLANRLAYRYKEACERPAWARSP